MERVYEIGRVFRNEGISPRHNPEFTMLEAYQAYGDYRSMMDLTEALIVDAIDALGGGYQRPWGETTIDFTPPLAAPDVRRAVPRARRRRSRPTPTAVAAQAESLGHRHGRQGPRRDRERGVRGAGRGPARSARSSSSTTRPAICPLTKRKAANPAVAERFELFVQGMELANAYTELNDPTCRSSCSASSSPGQADEDSMAKMDDDFVRALRHGMPPAGGLGIGIDRLVMLLTEHAEHPRRDPVPAAAARRAAVSPSRRLDVETDAIAIDRCRPHARVTADSIHGRSGRDVQVPALLAVSPHPLHRAGLHHQRDARAWRR